MTITKDRKTSVIKEFGVRDGNTGSADVQIALLTERINDLTGHLKNHPKDHHSRRGLLMMVSRRNRHLKYLAATNVQHYRTLTDKLGIRSKF
jgi:small subunit ribosomal protein S15